MAAFLSTVGLSAFLLFLVQPVIARQILPWFGGSAAVWTTCMVFFQLALLAGYAYADLMARKLSPRRQMQVHAAMLLVSLAVLPIAPSEALKPADADNPIGRILLLLAATIGLPYLMLSTTGPLVQAWFVRRYAGTPKVASVWRLYALSNVASMLALLAYPPLIEPATSGREQSLAWSAGYVLFVLLGLRSAWLGTRGAPIIENVPAASPPPSGTDAAVPDTETAEPAPAGPRAQLMWLLLPALASVLLLTITTHITQNVASVPFLWVLPLALYLLTFILTFDGRGWYWPRTYRVLAAVAALLMTGGLAWRIGRDWKPDDGVDALLEHGVMPIYTAVPLYAVGLFVLCMYCHGELVRRKPATAQLTRFYLMVSLGGAVGGLLVGIVAPLTLNWTWELPAALTLVPLLLMAAARRWWKLPALLVLAGCGWLAWDYADQVGESGIAINRNFYGTLRVKSVGDEDSGGARWRLMHGVITHGEQWQAPARRREPTTYYAPTSGVALALAGLRELAPGQPQRVGLIGLGVGTLAAWGRPCDTYRFYELDPEVLDLARRHFTFLKDSPARIETALGDARLVLEHEPDGRFDLLAVDAFSSDAIPVHLLTREAMAVYRRHVQAGGVIALHITNRYLDLRPVAQALAHEMGWPAWLVEDDAATTTQFESDWVIVTRNAALLAWLKERASGSGQALEGPSRLKSWSDDHHNLFEVLK